GLYNNSLNSTSSFGPGKQQIRHSESYSKKIFQPLF
ncbi:unnamed protein product, partial [Rotaria sordida]